tara:strand:+ start:3277 stop:3534 length:258 start_codon:yes stop_codon:yes gene_type:complete
MEKVDTELYARALANFDSFCDGFERAASESFLRGESGQPTTLDKYTNKYRTNTPRVVEEISGLGGEGTTTGEPAIDVQTPDQSGA